MNRWQVVARNLAEHARNKIHTDEGAQAAGYPAALVAGVTTYAYLTRWPAQRWGIDWARCGGGEVRFAAPVFAGDLVDIDEYDGVVSARVGDSVRASLAVAAPRSSPHPVPALHSGSTERPVSTGEALSDLTVTLAGEWHDYGWRAGEDLELYRRHDVVHPAVWPALANTVFQAQLVRGSWVHTRSAIHHHDIAQVGESVTVRTEVTRRFATRAGERAVANVAITGDDGRLVASLEHEAIVALDPR
jgi:acyl dehydratase